MRQVPLGERQATRLSLCPAKLSKQHLAVAMPPAHPERMLPLVVATSVRSQAEIGERGYRPSQSDQLPVELQQHPVVASAPAAHDPAWRPETLIQPEGLAARPASRRRRTPACGPPHRFHQVIVQVADEVLEWSRLTILLAHEEQRNERREQDSASRQLQPLEPELLAEAGPPAFCCLSDRGSWRRRRTARPAQPSVELP